MSRRRGSKRDEARHAQERHTLATIQRALADVEKRGLLTLKPVPAASGTAALEVVRYLWADGYNIVRRAERRA